MSKGDVLGLSLLLGVVLFMVGFGAQTLVGDHFAQAKYLPRQVSNFYLGMPFKEFKALR